MKIGTKEKNSYALFIQYTLNPFDGDLFAKRNGNLFPQQRRERKNRGNKQIQSAVCINIYFLIAKMRILNLIFLYVPRLLCRQQQH